MKTSGSPCPLDQLSIICFKRCPFLRSYLTELFRAVWLSGAIPDEWKKACTILIHKRMTLILLQISAQLLSRPYHLKYLPLAYGIQYSPS